MKATHLIPVLIVFSIFQISCKPQQSNVETIVAKEPLVVFLARHAEKADKSKDPDLSETGQERAESLAHVLRDANIEYVHATQYVRTQQTAIPSAEQAGLDIQIYDPRDLSTIADSLKSIRGRHLVLGHSNTTPSLVNLLGGEEGPPIDEPSEYDRLYVVTIEGDSIVNTILMRYGEPYLEGLIEEINN